MTRFEQPFQAREIPKTAPFARDPRASAQADRLSFLLSNNLTGAEQLEGNLVGQIYKSWGERSYNVLQKNGVIARIAQVKGQVTGSTTLPEAVKNDLEIKLEHLENMLQPDIQRPYDVIRRAQQLIASTDAQDGRQALANDPAVASASVLGKEILANLHAQTPATFAYAPRRAGYPDAERKNQEWHIVSTGLFMAATSIAAVTGGVAAISKEGERNFTPTWIALVVAGLAAARGSLGKTRAERVGEKTAFVSDADRADVGARTSFLTNRGEWDKLDNGYGLRGQEVGSFVRNFYAAREAGTDDVLWEALKSRDPLTPEQAARVLALAPDPLVQEKLKAMMASDNGREIGGDFRQLVTFLLSAGYDTEAQGIIITFIESGASRNYLQNVKPGHPRQNVVI